MGTIILIDKDDTLIDVRAERLTDDRIKDVVMQLQLQGVRIGLHSDSPLRSLAEIQLQLGMGGPTIAELGTIVALEPSTQPIYALGDELRQFLYGLRYELAGFAQTIFAEVWLGDVVEHRLSARFGTTRRSVIGINARRQSSCMGFSWRVDDEGVLLPNVNLLHEVSSWLVSHFSKKDFEVVQNERYGVFAVHASVASKQLGTDCLRAECPHDRVIMIGNALIDWCGPDVLHTAVANADEAYKLLSTYISPYDYTSGVIDILERILRGEL